MQGSLPLAKLSSIKGRWYTMTRNENRNGTGSQPKKKKGSKKTASDTSPCSSEEEENPHGDSTIGLPQTSDDWVLPESENIPLTHPDAVHHQETSRSVKIPGHQRLVTLPNSTRGEDPHTFVLSVYISTIPNAGRGLYLTYRGPNAYWTVPDYIDLGCYAPHQASDIKQDFIMEIKNFLYDDQPSEWSFDAPVPEISGDDEEDEEGSEARGTTIHGKKIINDMLFDITDDATGEVHEMAEKTLLPFVNEVTVQGKNVSGLLKQVQNIDAMHHDDGTLHYLLRSGCRFKRGETTELLVYYGANYDGHRNHKTAYSDRKECSHHTPVVVVKNRRASVDNDDLSTITHPSAQDGDDMVANDGGLLTASGHPIQQSICPSCNERSTQLCVKTKSSVSLYTNMRKSIFTYTEKDINAILDLFLTSPPIESAPRQRMRWILDQLRPYLTQILYRRDLEIPPSMENKLMQAVRLFPRMDSPHHEEDMKAYQKYQFMGVMVRKEFGHTGFKTGMVEHIVTSRSGRKNGRPRS